MPLSYTDYYEVLGVSRDADQDAIRRAYRKLARKYHPDLNSDSDAEERFKALGEAYEVLSDAEKRERYDRLGTRWREVEQQAPEESFEDFFAEQGFGDQRVEFGEDLFEALFGARAGRAGGPLRGHDREATLELSLEDALAGGRRRLTLDGREVTVNFPAGVRDGQLIRLAGQGAEGRGGGPPGDLFLRVAVKPHPRFGRRGDDDLDVEVPITPPQATLGTTVDVETPTGTARVRVPAGSSSGRRLRLRGRGLPKRGGGSGDLHAVVKIVVPKALSERQRELYEQLAEAESPEPREV
ncbi:MAG TPA: DnaJ C-terminal domain-containing protein [Solirubrobacteraceae bacterium]|nr:DnaJ C-terminal domain-containing protein [Solirubrobacteraceae bacterium]